MKSSRPRPSFAATTVAASLAIFLAISLAGCSNDASGPTESSTVPATVAGVGSLPPIGLYLEVPGAVPSTFTDGRRIPVQQSTVGEAATGPRVLMIGDSILAMVSRRFTNIACKSIVPLGWQMSIEAEIGRGITFASTVLDAKDPDEWDAFVLFLGTNYWGNRPEYKRVLGQVLDEMSPRPVVLFTTSEFRQSQRDVNSAIENEVISRDNVWFVDWRAISKAPGVLAGDGIHPSADGNDFLVEKISQVLGRAPGDGKGACLPSDFDTDMEAPEAISDIVDDGATGDDTDDTSVPDSSSTTPRTPGDSTP
ncbi:MAG: hypothetical protein B7C54_03985 [Acidimicrobiales bacterium mtb01]|nr:hypothetical protein [Actinomycetota bacterium]TEX46387.1 MAG: hypothetical protein B7C54_03985 [Acidimicrobiales bacterium mtb01]